MSKIIQMSECVESGEYSATFIFLVMNTFHPGPEICLGSDSHEIGKSTDIAFHRKILSSSGDINWWYFFGKDCMTLKKMYVVGLVSCGSWHKWC